MQIAVRPHLVLMRCSHGLCFCAMITNDAPSYPAYYLGNLSWLVKPGGETLDYGWIPGQNSSVRDSLANDAIVRRQACRMTVPPLTNHCYDVLGRASAITAPPPKLAILSSSKHLNIYHIQCHSVRYLQSGGGDHFVTTGSSPSISKNQQALQGAY